MKYHPILLSAVLWITNPSLLVLAQDGTDPLVAPPQNPSDSAFDSPKGSPENVSGTEPAADKLTAENLIITRSDDRTEVRGFSATKGTWENLTLPKSESFEWFAEGDIALVRAADTLAAFSAETGHWDVLQLSKDSKAVPVMQGSIATIEDGGHFYTFSAKTSSWTSPTDTRLAFGQMLLPSMELSPDTLAAFQTWSDSQPRHKTFSLTRTVGGVGLSASRKEYLDEAVSILNKLIAESQETASTILEPDPFAGGSKNAAPSNGDRNSILNRSPSPDELQRLGMRINSLKRDAVHREGMLKSFARGRDLSKPEVMTELREATTVAFDKRQGWYEAEAKRLEMRLQQIQSEIAQRKSTREDIIERQLQQLKRLPPQPSDAMLKQPATNDAVLSEPVQPVELPISSGDRALTADSKLWASSPKSPTDTLRALRGAKATVEGLQKELNDCQQQIEKYSRPLDELKNDPASGFSSKATEQDVDRVIQTLRDTIRRKMEERQSAEADWSLLWEEYQSQVKLLTSELQSAQIKTEQARKLLATSQPLVQVGAIPQSELQSHEALARESEQELIRAQERLRLLSILQEQYPELKPVKKSDPYKG